MCERHQRDGEARSQAHTDHDHECVEGRHGHGHHGDAHEVRSVAVHRREALTAHGTPKRRWTLPLVSETSRQGVRA